MTTLLFLGYNDHSAQAEYDYPVQAVGDYPVQAVGDNSVQAVGDNSVLAASSCYKKVILYGGWKRIDVAPYNVNIKYIYSQRGAYNYSTRISNAARTWQNAFPNIFKFSQVSSGNNLLISSDDYGNVPWVGLTDKNSNPKKIQLNDWHYDNTVWFDHTVYENVALHELGHTHGLDHPSASCVNEVMSDSSQRDWYQVHLGEGDKAGIKDIY
nr:MULTISPECIES: matrixin family metalloprotease [unclassified Sporosarcina]